MLMSRQSLEPFIKSLGPRIFGILFVKRTTGELRSMNCRQGVTKHLAGGDAAYNFHEKRLVSVYDLEKEGYRSIPLENVLQVTADGVTYDVTE